MTPVSVSELFQPSLGAISIIDPELKPFGRLWFPLERLLPTSGLERYLSGHPYPPSLCLLFQKQRCQQGPRCNQIHVDCDFVSEVRHLLIRKGFRDCCHVHGDLPSCRRDFRELCGRLCLTLVRSDGSRVNVPAESLAFTAYWSRILSESHSSGPVFLTIVKPDLCLLHQRGGCRHGHDCKHVHLCHQKFRELLPPAGTRTPPRTPSPTPGFVPLTSFPAPVPVAAVPVERIGRPLPSFRSVGSGVTLSLPPHTAPQLARGANGWRPQGRRVHEPTSPTSADSIGRQMLSLIDDWAEPTPHAACDVVPEVMPPFPLAISARS